MRFGRLLGRSRAKRKVFVVGLDCAAPELVFGRWRADLPNLSRLARDGLWGELESCIPAITVPAWTSMLSSRDPGTLGIYGFRNRADYSYASMTVATSSAVGYKRVWDYLGNAGKVSVLVGVPQTYPVMPINGCLVSDFLTPSIESEFTYPAALREQILTVAPAYQVDVPQFRTEDKGWLLRQIYDMTEQRFRAVDYLLANIPWDFAMVVEIGVDRIHHGFWQYHDTQHFRYQPGNSYESAIHDYYVFIDSKLGEWLDRIGEETAVMVVSDHGAKRMDGGICLNEWLWREGYLVLKEDPKPGRVSRFEPLLVDWPRTRAWGSGGYYGRVFLNVRGREPEGAIQAGEYEAVRDELAARLCAICGPAGEHLGTRVFRPEQVYREVNGIPPDLIVYFGDLSWRSVGSIGHGSIHTFDNDTGPDDCNHAQNGLVILYDPARPGNGRRLAGAHLMDVAPTVQALMGQPVPEEMQGKLLWERG